MSGEEQDLRDDLRGLPFERRMEEEVRERGGDGVGRVESGEVDKGEEQGKGTARWVGLWFWGCGCFGLKTGERFSVLRERRRALLCLSLRGCLGSSMSGDSSSSSSSSCSSLGKWNTDFLAAWSALRRGRAPIEVKAPGLRSSEKKEVLV